MVPGRAAGDAGGAAAGVVHASPGRVALRVKGRPGAAAGGVWPSVGAVAPSLDGHRRPASRPLHPRRPSRASLPPAPCPLWASGTRRFPRRACVHACVRTLRAVRSAASPERPRGRAWSCAGADGWPEPAVPGPRLRARGGAVRRRAPVEPSFGPRRGLDPGSGPGLRCLRLGALMPVAGVGPGPGGSRLPGGDGWPRDREQVWSSRDRVRRRPARLGSGAGRTGRPREWGRPPGSGRAGKGGAADASRTRAAGSGWVAARPGGPAATSAAEEGTAPEREQAQQQPQGPPSEGKGLVLVSPRLVRTGWRVSWGFPARSVLGSAPGCGCWVGGESRVSRPWGDRKVGGPSESWLWSKGAGPSGPPGPSLATASWLLDPRPLDQGQPEGWRSYVLHCGPILATGERAAFTPA
nr:translation initiation factor IF-2-like [Chlorocebus sabaeus]